MTAHPPTRSSGWSTIGVLAFLCAVQWFPPFALGGTTTGTLVPSPHWVKPPTPSLFNAGGTRNNTLPPGSLASLPIGSLRQREEPRPLGKLRLYDCLASHPNHPNFEEYPTLSEVWDANERNDYDSWKLRWNLTADNLEALAQMRTRPARGSGGGNTLLHFACLCDAPPEVIAQLLTGPPRFSVTSRNAYGRTPLHLAAEGNSHPEVIGLLLDAGADIEALDDGFPGNNNLDMHPEPRATPLFRAALHNPAAEVTKALLAAGAAIETRALDVSHESDLGGATPLIAATAYNSVEVLEALVAGGADARTDVHYPSNLAAQPAVRIGPPRERDLGQTALHYAAAYRRNPAFIDVLVAAGSDLEAQTGAAVDSRGSSGRVRCTTDSPRIPGLTPLHVAARSQKNPAVVEALLSAGAQMNAVTCYGETALDFIARYNDALKETAVYWRLHEARYQR